MIITDNIVTGRLTDGTNFQVTIPFGTDIVSKLEDRGVSITAKSPESSPFWSISSMASALSATASVIRPSWRTCA